MDACLTGATPGVGLVFMKSNGTVFVCVPRRNLMVRQKRVGLS
jgi:ribosomal protein L24E